MRGWTILLLLSVILAAPAFADDTTKNPAPTGDALRGEAMAKHWCGSCHVVGGAGTGSDAAPTFATVAHDPARGPDYIRAFLTRPHKPMPPFSFSRQEIEDFVAYFADLKARP